MKTVLAVGLLAPFGVLETLAGIYSRGKLRGDDWIINLGSLDHLAIIVRPAMVGVVACLLGGLAAEFEGALASTPLWIAVLLPEEFLHYGYRRKGHVWGSLWKIHRTHHTTPSMNAGFTVLPGTHRAHHGFGEWSHEQGNYATLVFFYDVIFGTAALPHHPPTSIGIEYDPRDPWYVRLYWSFVKASDPTRELAATRLRRPVSEN